MATGYGASAYVSTLSLRPLEAEEEEEEELPKKEASLQNSTLTHKLLREVSNNNIDKLSKASAFLSQHNLKLEFGKTAGGLRNIVGVRFFQDNGNLSPKTYDYVTDLIFKTSNSIAVVQVGCYYRFVQVVTQRLGGNSNGDSHSLKSVQAKVTHL